MERKRICPSCGGTIHAEQCLLCEMFESQAVPGGHHTTTWNQKSRALAVHPNQIPAQMAHAKRMGVPTVFDAKGHPIFTSRGHRASYMKQVETRYVDYDGGYSDTTESTARRERWE